MGTAKATRVGRRRRSPISRVARWAGVVVCVAILVVFAISLRWTHLITRYPSFGEKHRFTLIVANGGLICLVGQGYGFNADAIYVWDVMRSSRGIRWRAERLIENQISMRGMFLPLWIPLLFFVVPTAILFRSPRTATRQTRDGK